MDRLYKLVEGANARFPEGVQPYKILARVLEECGEVAGQVHHFEGSGVKRAKHGEPSREKLAGEIRQALTALMSLAVYYNIEGELAQSIDASIDRMMKEGILRP